MEPFCGAAHVLSKMSGRRVASDLSEDLILLWQAIQNGWIPPDSVSEEEYQRLKTSSPSALRGFAGYGLSFSGKWFGGYARNSRGDNYCAYARNSLLKQKQSINDVLFLHAPYSIYNDLENYLIYCDPPYANTTKYRFGEFDSKSFWNWCRVTSRSNKVVVSEYSAPADFKCVLEINTKTHMRGANNLRVERLFQYNA